jgi:microcystin-dependent protein
MKAGSAQWGSVGAIYGEKTHTQTSTEMPVHTHIQDAHAHITVDGNISSNQGPWYAQGGGIYNIRTAGDITRWSYNTTATNQNAGGGAAFNVIQPTRAALLCIKI